MSQNESWQSKHKYMKGFDVIYVYEKQYVLLFSGKLWENSGNGRQIQIELNYVFKEVLAFITVL